VDGIDQSVARMHRPPNAHTPLPLPTLPHAHSRVRQSPAIENVGARGGTPNVNLGHSQRVVRHQIHPAVAPELRPRILGIATGHAGHRGLCTRLPRVHCVAYRDLVGYIGRKKYVPAPRKQPPRVAVVPERRL